MNRLKQRSSEDYIKKITRLMRKGDFPINEVNSRRVFNYHYGKNTKIKMSIDRITISTETNIKGVYNTLHLFSDGRSEVKLDFDNPFS